MIIVDGLNGDVIVNPTEDELIAYQDKRERYFADKKELQKLRDADTVTVDELFRRAYCKYWYT